MIMTGNVVGFEIAEKGDSTTQTVILDVMFTDRDDIRPVEWLVGPGRDSVPSFGSRVIVFQLSSGYLVSFGGNDGITPESDEGEEEIYSSVSGVKKARVKTKNDGLIAIANDLHELKDLMGELFTEIKAITTFGSPTSHQVTAASKLALDAVETKFNALFGTF